MEQREKSSKDVVSSGVWLNVESLEKLEGNQSYAKLSAGARILSRSISPPWAWGCKEGRASPAFAESAACGPRAELWVGSSCESSAFHFRSSLCRGWAAGHEQAPVASTANPQIRKSAGAALRVQWLNVTVSVLRAQTPRSRWKRRNHSSRPQLPFGLRGFWFWVFSVVVFIPQSVRFYQTFCFLNMLLLKSFLKEPTLESKRKLPKI